MKKRPAGLSPLNFVLACACLAAWATAETVVNVRARTTCTPPPVDKLNVGYYWTAGTTVSVEIDDAWEQDDRDALTNGAQMWNSYGMLDCSLVNFTSFAPRHFADYDSFPPANTFWFQKADPGTGYNGNVSFNVGGAPLHLISAKDKIGPTVVNIVNKTYFVYLGSHELGHTFALLDCLCSNKCNCFGEDGMSIMAGSSSNNASYNTRGPQSCDAAAMRTIYCPPPTPTPTPTPPTTCAAGCGGFTQLEFESSHSHPSCGRGVDWCAYPSTGCPSTIYAYNWEDTCCCNQPYTPVIIDVAGDGFRMTDSGAA